MTALGGWSSEKTPAHKYLSSVIPLIHSPIAVQLNFISEPAISHIMFSARQIFAQVQRRGFAASARQVSLPYDC